MEKLQSHLRTAREIRSGLATLILLQSEVIRAGKDILQSTVYSLQSTVYTQTINYSLPSPFPSQSCISSTSPYYGYIKCCIININIKYTITNIYIYLLKEMCMNLNNLENQLNSSNSNLTLTPSFRQRHHCENK